MNGFPLAHSSFTVSNDITPFTAYTYSLCYILHVFFSIFTVIYLRKR
jgi:hypothetical protein